jgi:hypothetical protein
VAIEANAVKEADKAGKLDKHNEADDANNKTEVAIEAEADEDNDAAEAVEAVEAKAGEGNDAVEAADSIVIHEVVLGLLTWFVPFSLTKHSAIFVEVKGCFEFLDMNKNQLGTFCIECDWGSTCSLRN